MQKCLPYSQNAFNSVHIYKTVPSFSDDKLGEFLSSTCVNTISYVTSQKLVLSQSLKVSYHYTHGYSCGPVDLDYNTCSQVNEYKCWRELTTSVYYENSGKMCFQNSTNLEDYNSGTTLKTKIWISVTKLKFQTCFSFFFTITGNSWDWTPWHLNATLVLLMNKKMQSCITVRGE